MAAVKKCEWWGEVQKILFSKCLLLPCLLEASLHYHRASVGLWGQFSALEQRASEGLAFPWGCPATVAMWDGDFDVARDSAWLKLPLGQLSCRSISPWGCHSQAYGPVRTEIRMASCLGGEPSSWGQSPDSSEPRWGAFKTNEV